MLDINLLRNNLEEIKKNLQKKGFEFDSKAFEESMGSIPAVN